MKLEWKIDQEIGAYKCIITDENGDYEDIHLQDYNFEEHKQRMENDIRYKELHPYAYEVRYCNGYSMHRGFDASHSLEDVKLWCENYLLDKYIDQYNRVLANLDKLKQRAEWAEQIKESRFK